jgi:hypothetical protein
VVAGGTLTLASLTMTSSASYIEGSGNVEVTSSFTWQNGRLQGSGTFTIQSGAVASFSSSTSTPYLYISGSRLFVNAGTINWNQGYLHLITTTANFRNDALLSVTGAATFYRSSSTTGTSFQVTNSASGSIGVSGSLTVTDVGFQNDGSITVTGSSAYLQTLDSSSGVAETFSSSGTVSLFSSGQARFSSTVAFAGNNVLLHDGSIGATVVVQADKTTFSGNNIGLPSVRCEGGTLALEGATSTIRDAVLSVGYLESGAGSLVTVAALTLSGSSTYVQGSGNFVVTSTFTWQYGWLQGSGTWYHRQ